MWNRGWQHAFIQQQHQHHSGGRQFADRRGASMINTGGFQGVHVNVGVLSAWNNQAFGISGTVNANQVWINSDGTFELANAITMDNGVSLNLDNGGAIRSSGSTTTNGRINVGTAAGTSVTLSAVGSSDVFTVGNGIVTGGAADTVVKIGGAGTVLLNASSTYVGSILINSGNLKLGSATALGAATTRVRIDLPLAGLLI